MSLGVAVVTGAGSGIGLAIVAALAERGDTVYMTGRRKTVVSERAAELDPSGSRVLPVEVDVRDPEAVAAVVQRAVAEHGCLHYMVNNAGISIGGEVQELTVQHWRRIVDINLRGVVHGVSAAYPVMLRQGFGHILNVSSLSGLCPSGLLAPYVTTKHAVVGLSLSLRAEASSRGVRVSVLCPGFVDTPMLDSKGPDDLPKSRLIEAVDVREQANSTPKGPYPPEKLARDALRGMERNRAVIITPLGPRLVWRVYRWVPALFDSLGPKNVARFREMGREMGSGASVSSDSISAEPVESR
jgi:NAD(P)-dependent dehydrogenase (short-subunit alcohol dehydrogenase family)